MHIHRLLLILLFLQGGLIAETIFREDFKSADPHVPITSQDLTSTFLKLERSGPGADLLKLSHHHKIPNDPHYLWNGLCQGASMAAFSFRSTIDLSKDRWSIQARTKNSGQSTLHIAVRNKNRWLVAEEHFQNKSDWNVQTIQFSNLTWRTLDPDKAKLGDVAKTVDLSSIHAIGFVSPLTPNRSSDCTRLDWFELIRTPNSPLSLPSNGFLQKEFPFIRSALSFQRNGIDYSVRRGVIVPLNYKNRWACFDPDHLEWRVIWEAPEGKAPFSYDSMAAVSFPDKEGKATKAPELLGKILLISPLQSDRPSKQKMGPLSLDNGRWLGIKLKGGSAIISYRKDDNIYEERASSSPMHQLSIDRIKSNAVDQKLSTTINVSKGAPTKNIKIAIPKWKTNPPVFQDSYWIESDRERSFGPLLTRTMKFPTFARPIRATDIAFLSNGVAYLTTFDGDIWRIDDIESIRSKWSRVGTGIFEPMAIETSPDDKIFVLGRDQITELIDTNNDTYFDFYRNASDQFIQTMHTRDYATSLDIGKDGSFYLAKGGIAGRKGSKDQEMSTHRGSLIKISPDGNTLEILADGLRMPYIGLRNDGAIFASDQQGQFVPSTPIYYLPPNSTEQPNFGYSPTNHRQLDPKEPPYLYFPYTHNRSGAAFASLNKLDTFPDLSPAFLHVSWNGSLFSVLTPEAGVNFSYQWPLQLNFPALNASVHPISKKLYTVGLGISGYRATTKKNVGLASISQGLPFPTPRQIFASKEQLIIHLNRPLSTKETITGGNEGLRLFNVKRSEKYGSGHYLSNGEPGEHRQPIKQILISKDRKFLTIPLTSLFASDISVLQLNVKMESSEQKWPLFIYFDTQSLEKATEEDTQKLARFNKPKTQWKADSTRGKKVFQRYSCAGCHALDGTKLTGPPLNGIGQRSTKKHLKASILTPSDTITEGYTPTMPSFKGVISQQELEDLISYLSSL